ncbi:fused MFS/spermidine synthase [Coralloluteibacterium stylophorae]|uniref:Fused MFS/spermidine synthase n=1 Tax=Coralloluteibacterium stylophorae TaxID=1776034 RepID=A0AAP2CD30_9GAMM|nr:fused MFS/spermidine synthase [Coralloluteibacterium stylophorae]MBS7457720.1 fused MFS/spermidine synthase [Coralloluteibacterium stylophorae]
MTSNARFLGRALLGLFLLSGSAGLIYQAVWSHYLGLVLGHAAYAQTLVLAIYMGGMAVGAALVSRYGARLRSLIKAYAIAELLIGLGGVAFHPVFEAYVDSSQRTVLPMIDSLSLAHAYQWFSAALLIMPQSILLGATFPLMSGGFRRAIPGDDGRMLGGLYFTNSLGASVGVLLAAFLLLPAVGMPGSLLTAGLLNMLVALFAWFFGRALEQSEEVRGSAVGLRNDSSSTAASARDPSSLRRLSIGMIGATFASGAASFVYEIGWVRLLNQALGTTIHSFELMLAAFVFGLAFGGLWVRRRSARIGDAVRAVGWVQLCMGVAALISIPVFSRSFEWVGWMMGALARSESGYLLFSLGSAVLSLLVMFPAAFFAGMTLPLFTMALLRAGSSESAIGRIYAANTVGGILGVMLAVHLLIPAMGVHLTVTLAALVDAVIGLLLLRATGSAFSRWGDVRLGGAGVIAAVALLLSLVLGRPDMLAQSSGVFRTGVATLPGTEVFYFRDGKTATVSVTGRDGMTIISTNGKPDASIAPLSDAPTADEVTMVMAGLLPLVKHPAPEEVAVIGWGSGLTTHTLLGSGKPQVVDSVEIERAMFEGAEMFGGNVLRAYIDSRSRVHFDDARTFFAAGARRYDAIISEPSNPWVSGVASLFTVEFYRFLNGHLKDDGVLVQWLQSYEIDDSLIATMIAALIEVFPNSEIYLTNQADLLILARKGEGQGLDRQVWSEAALAGELERVGLGSPQELELRRIGGGTLLRNFVSMFNAPIHSDYFPKVALGAPQARYVGRSSDLFQRLVMSGLPVLDMIDCRSPPAITDQIADAEFGLFADAHHLAREVARSFDDGAATAVLQLRSMADAAAVNTMLRAAWPSEPNQDLRLWSMAVATIAQSTIGHLLPQDQQSVWFSPEWGRRVEGSVQKAAILAAFQAAAERNARAMLINAQRVLQLQDDRIPGLLREQMLVIAITGAIASDHNDLAAALEVEYGARIPRSQLGSVRQFLQAWAANGHGGCSPGGGRGRLGPH